MNNSKYWQKEGARKAFTHELELEWLDRFDRSIRVLDFGCGYGRVTNQLFKMGFENVTGFDPSETMIERAVKENSGPKYTATLDDFAYRKFDLIISFALFTSCPSDEEQCRLVETINAHASKGAYVYISDYIMDDNPHYLERYNEKKLGVYGCFASGTSAVFRHHPANHFATLFMGWGKIKERKETGKTLNGNQIVISQYLYKYAG